MSKIEDQLQHIIHGDYAVETSKAARISLAGGLQTLVAAIDDGVDHSMAHAILDEHIRLIEALKEELS